MKKIILITLFTISLSACDNYITPTGAVQTVAGYLAKGDLPNFTAGLTGNALANLGNLQSMTALSIEFADFRGIQIGEPKLIATKRNPNWDGYLTGTRIYSVPILARTSHILNVEVRCKLYRVRRCPSVGPCTPIDFDEYTECKVSDIAATGLE